MIRSLTLLALLSALWPCAALSGATYPPTISVQADGFETSFDSMRGGWAMTWDSFGLSGAEHFVIADTFVSSDGTEYLVVERAFSSVGLGLTRYEPDLEAWFLLLDSSTNYYKAFVYDLRGGEVDGRYWLYRKDESLSGAGYWMRGFHFAELAQLGVAAAKAGPGHGNPELLDQLAQEHAQPAEGAAPAAVIERLLNAAAALEEMRGARGSRVRK